MPEPGRTPVRRIVILAVGGTLAALLGGCATSPPVMPTTPVTAVAEPYRCDQPAVGPLPEWARTGFTPPDQPVAHLMSVGGHMVAVPFGWPLRDRQPAGRSNKILWVADVDNGGPMTIRATRESDPTVVERDLPNGPGPSIVDLPAAGCWRLDLAWPGGDDRVYLEYLPKAG